MGIVAALQAILRKRVPTMPQTPFYCLPQGDPDIATTELSMIVSLAVRIMSADGHTVGNDSIELTLPGASAKAVTVEEKTSVKETIKSLLIAAQKDVVTKWEDKVSLKAMAAEAVAETQA